MYASWSFVNIIDRQGLGAWWLGVDNMQFGHADYGLYDWPWLLFEITVFSESMMIEELTCMGSVECLNI